MRLDQFLKATHLVKRRELAKELCDDGCVRVNGSPRKPSAEVSPGDVLDFPVYNRLLKVRVLGVPKGDTPKGGQWEFVEVLEEKRFSVDEGPGPWPTDGRAKTPTYH
jgi:ribosomal 50S subunit-recycling heat shock protein